MESHCLSYAGEIRILEVGVGIQQAIDLHLELDETQRTVVEHSNLDRDLLLNGGD
jgi:hypothetical protein